ncbi:MAG: UvrB/UvrC motif-containing protein, partial [Planctomycetota bacterium]|nr:UvrB/UvrC motif-containing protein [Planctomycetota bacterium]
IADLEKEMLAAADLMEFERAAELRDQIVALEGKTLKKRRTGRGPDMPGAPASADVGGRRPSRLTRPIRPTGRTNVPQSGPATR